MQKLKKIENIFRIFGRKRLRPSALDLRNARRIGTMPSERAGEPIGFNCKYMYN